MVAPLPLPLPASSDTDEAGGSVRADTANPCAWCWLDSWRPAERGDTGEPPPPPLVC